MLLPVVILQRFQDLFGRLYQLHRFKFPQKKSCYQRYIHIAGNSILCYCGSDPKQQDSVAVVS